MRIHELEILNIRGIKQICLKPDGHNFVITGSNGSGKSAVVDALDFLLTGKIQRLMGKGTGSLSLKQHGPHIDTKPQDTNVRAIITIPNYKQPFEISRSLASPDILLYPPDVKEQLQPVLNLAKRGQHVLSRREILKYITSEPSDRATEIQTLLKLSDIEDTRKALVTARTELKRDNESAGKALKDAQAAFAIAAQLQVFSESEILKAVNVQRAILEGTQIDDLSLHELKKDLSEPATQQKPDLNVTLLQSDLKQLGELLVDSVISRRSEKIHSLITNCKAVLSSPSLKLLSDRLNLAEIGYSLIDDSGNCPLCDTEWESGILANYLESKIASGKTASATLTAINENSSSLIEDLRKFRSIIKRLLDGAITANLSDVITSVQNWQELAKSIDSALNSPYSQASIAIISESFFPRLGLSSQTFGTISNMIDTLLETTPKLSPKQIAWDILTRIEEHIKLWNMTRDKASSAQRAHDRGVALVTEFEKARDAVLGNLYDTIKSRFVTLYRLLHKSDESTFDATLKPSGAGLAFEVDFYGKGNHPPHALHSEGHQDSMGLCLYLSLAEHLNTSIIDMVILDDVVMSVDTGHRREFCRLIADQFPSKQFVITTHDRAWAGQLRTEGIVVAKNIFSFYNWSVDCGPCLDQGVTQWSTIEKDLERDDVHRAAHALRHGLEAFFRQIASALSAPIPYNLSERWDLGNFLYASITQLKHYIKIAKEASNSWGDQETVEKLKEFDSILSQTIKKSQFEWWGINANVHYNNWANFTKPDFVPVVEAMQELCVQFTCPKCDCILEVEYIGLDARSLRCPCNAISYTLVKKNNTLKPALS